MIKLSAPPGNINAAIRLSGSKSISNRLLMINAVLNQECFFNNLSGSEDTALLKKALEQLKHKTNASLDVHHAGTDMRFLTAFLAAKEGEWILTGSDRMKERPIGGLVSALRKLGAEINYPGKENFPPLHIKGKNLKGGSVEIDSSVSSQFISALLLAAPAFEKGLSLALTGKTVSMPYIEMTCALLRLAGITVVQKENEISVSPASAASRLPSPVFIESDWSSASYWYSICALSPGSFIELQALDKKSLQADSVLPGLYKNLGVNTEFKEQAVVLTSVKPVSGEFSYDFTNCPDIAQTLAVTCFGLGIKAQLRGLSTLKVKETDRILALKTELETCGAVVEAGDDFIQLGSSGRTQATNSPLLIRTYNDHRMAMSFAPLALLYRELLIEDAAVVSKSYPAFWEDLKSVGFNVNLSP